MTSAATMRAQIAESVAHVQARAEMVPRVGLILGTGLGDVASHLDIVSELSYADIPHLAPATVASHAGRLIFGYHAGQPVAVLQGRHHYYEGGTMQQLVLPVRILHALGAHTLLLTSACGGMHPLWSTGDVVLLSDHINLMGDNPLIGENLNELGPRFPDMSEPYDRALQDMTMRVALTLGIPLRRGVYAGVAGPNLETRAEYRMLRALGADMVGMSMVPEVIAARHMGMRVLAFSIVTDLCLPDALEPTDLETIVRNAGRAEPVLARLVRGVLEQMEAADVLVGGGVS